MLTTSFAQGFINALFQQMPIRFIQVGVNDAKLDDFLRWRCLTFGWTGLMIEPHPIYYKSGRETYSHYPKLIWEQVAIMDSAGEKDLYFIDAPPADKPWAPGIASFDLEHMKRHGFADGEISAVRVKCLPLSEVVARHCFYDVDLLVIDVEGLELDVIKSIDFSLFSVRLVVLETLHMKKEQFEEILGCFPPDYIGVYERTAVDGVIYKFDKNYVERGGFYRG